MVMLMIIKTSVLITTLPSLPPPPPDPPPPLTPLPLPPPPPNPSPPIQFRLHCQHLYIDNNNSDGYSDGGDGDDPLTIEMMVTLVTVKTSDKHDDNNIHDGDKKTISTMMVTTFRMAII